MYVQAAAGATELVRGSARELDGLGIGEDPETGFWAANVMVESGLLQEAAPVHAKAKQSMFWEQLPHADRVHGEAMAGLSSGAPDAEVLLRAAAAHPHLGIRSSASHVLARLLRERGSCGEVVTVLEKATSIPPSVVVAGRAFRIPLELHWLAECHEKLGDLTKARERNDEFLRLWADADPDLPLLAEATALQARLASAR